MATEFESIPKLLKGTALRELRVRWPDWAIASTPCYLMFIPIGGGGGRPRLTLKYVPGDPANDAEVITITKPEGPVKYWSFKKPPEWTKVPDNLREGLYILRPWIGDLTGYENEVPTDGVQLEVLPAEDGAALT